LVPGFRTLGSCLIVRLASRLYTWYKPPSITTLGLPLCANVDETLAARRISVEGGVREEA